MAKKEFYVNIDLNQQQILEASFEQVAADPTGFSGYEILNTTDGRRRCYVGGAWKTYAWLDDLNFMKFVGTHSAAGGSLPAAPLPPAIIKQGHVYMISAAGTIAGIDGADVLEVGDMLIAKVDAPAAASDWASIQTNLDLPANLAKTELVTVASLPANTLTTVTPSATFSAIHHVQVYDSANEDIALRMIRGAASVQVESNVALSNIKVAVSGL